MAPLYIINFAIGTVNRLTENQRIYLKEDSNPYFYDIYNAEFTMCYLKLKHPSNTYWITSMVAAKELA